MSEGHELWTVKDIAAHLKLNARHVRARVTTKADFPPCIMIGGSLRWKKTDVLEWIDEQETDRGSVKKAVA